VPPVSLRSRVDAFLAAFGHDSVAAEMSALKSVARHVGH